MITDWDKFEPEFSRKEFECPCGCGKADMDQDSLEMFYLMRKACEFPWIITSGYRCPGYNMQISSTGAEGPHTTGKAMDIAISGEKAHQLITLAANFGIKGIGVSQKGDHSSRFIHIDFIDEGTRPWIWSY